MRRSLSCLVLAVAASVAGAQPATRTQEGGCIEAGSDAAAALTGAELEARGMRIGTITLDKHDVFDTDQPGQRKSLYRLANRLHIVTRDEVIRRQLLFRSGEAYAQRVIDETERILRANPYFSDVGIRPVRVCGGVVDLQVTTRDVWTLSPGISGSVKGGESETGFELEEANLLGRGVAVSIEFLDEVERESTIFEFFDRQLGASWVSLGLRLADSDDGETRRIDLHRPFYALDARWAAGGGFLDDTRLEQLYALGEPVAQYGARRRYRHVYAGWSAGLTDGWVSRWTAGLVDDEARYQARPAGALLGVRPDDRRLVYPYVGYELREDRYAVTSNQAQIGRTEDLFLGTRFTARLGWAGRGLGSDREAVVFAAGLSRGFGSPRRDLLLVGGALSGRHEHGQFANTRVDVNARLFRRRSLRRAFVASAALTHVRRPDIDRPIELGGDSGLRGYPLRYQSGASRALVTLEQRYYTDWYPWKLVRVGGAVFADIGRTWGAGTIDVPNEGWLYDVGLGLRLGLSRSEGGKTVHIDVAFPLGAGPHVDAVQWNIEGKRGF